MRRYSELKKINSYKERFEYLKLDGSVGKETFGYDRYLNQALYSSPEWRKVRREVIIRDEGCDMGHPDYSIGSHVVVHHMNPITKEQIENGDPLIFDPEYLVCVSDNTHNAIHYSDATKIEKTFAERKPNDTCPWKRG